ncbi:MAG TPA: hypothetical protein VN088_00210 [Nocardioides sp.]|nr:hypothetical protein [Nocardioides sp.]
MTDLETRLRETLRGHAADAPTAAEIAGVRPRTSRARRRAPLLAVAATALVVAGAGIAGVQWRHHQPQPTQPSPTGAVIFVIGTPGAREGALEPVGIATPSSDAATLEALFTYRPTAGRSNPWNGVTLTALVHRGGLWRADIDRAPSWTGNDPEAVMQSLAWTLSTATESTDGILVTVGGTPLLTPRGTPTADGVPLYSYLALAGSQVSWPRRTCGSGQYVAVSDGHRWTMQNYVPGALGPGARPPKRVSIGSMLRVLPDGLCFRQADMTGIPERHRPLTWVPRHPGRYKLEITSGTCVNRGFTSRPVVCPGGPVTFASLDVQVVAH